MCPPLRETLPLAKEHRDGRREADRVDRVGIEEPAEEHGQLVAGARRVGREPPVVGQPLAVVEPEDGLRVADVDCEEHGASVSAREEPKPEARSQCRIGRIARTGSEPR